MAHPADEKETPRWRDDFPIRWERDHYVTRRELARFLTLGSALLAGASGVLAALGLRRRSRPATPPRRVASLSAIAPGGSVQFRYPTEADPCLLVRTPSDDLVAYSQVCTHLSCAVVHRAKEADLFCPCHHGVFAVDDGRPVAGPPLRRLPRVTLAVHGDDVIATGIVR